MRHTITKDKQESGYFAILGCIHAPFHNKAALNALLKLFTDIKLKGLILNGDFLDMHSLSSYDKQKVAIKDLTLYKEYEQAKELKDKLIIAGRPDIRVFLKGNHEARYDKYMAGVDNNKLGEALMSPTQGLELNGSWQIIDKYPGGEYQLGDLCIYHGQAYNMHVAYNELQIEKRSVLFNHTHRMQVYEEGRLSAYNAGWLGDQDQSVFAYTSRKMKKTWAVGFAMVHLDDDEKTHVQLLKFKNNKFYFNEREYSG